MVTESENVKTKNYILSKELPKVIKTKLES